MGYFLCEISFHVTFSHFDTAPTGKNTSPPLQPIDIENSLKTELINADPLTKYNLARILMHHVSYNKPDLEYHNNTNSSEIEYYLNENDFDFFKDFQNKIKNPSNSPEVRIHKVHKVIHAYSKVLGPPYPEKVFVRHKINIHIKNNPTKMQIPRSYQVLDKCTPKARSTPSRLSL